MTGSFSTSSSYWSCSSGPRVERVVLVTKTTPAAPTVTSGVADLFATGNFTGTEVVPFCVPGSTTVLSFPASQVTGGLSVQDNAFVGIDSTPAAVTTSALGTIASSNCALLMASYFTPADFSSITLLSSAALPSGTDLMVVLPPRITTLPAGTGPGFVFLGLCSRTEANCVVNISAPFNFTVSVEPLGSS